MMIIMLMKDDHNNDNAADIYNDHMNICNIYKDMSSRSRRKVCCVVPCTIYHRHEFMDGF